MKNLRKRASPPQLSNLRDSVARLIVSGCIETTLDKAKEVRWLADTLVQYGKKASLFNRRRVVGWLPLNWTFNMLFFHLWERYEDRAGGYTRVLRTPMQVGDAAPMACIELIGRENEIRQSKPANSQPPQRAPLDPWTRSRLSKQLAPPKYDKS